MKQKKENKGLNISARSFITAILILFALMLLTYILTLALPGGEYQRIADSAGNMVIDTEAGYTPVEGGLPFYKWLLSPLLILGQEGSGTIIAVIVFLLVIGGIFNSLDRCGLMLYMLKRVVGRFGQARYRLMAVVVLFFMAMGSFIGSFEEVIPLVPIVVSLAVGLGWDAITGVGMSILAAGCGFSAGVCNPFTVGIAQELAGLPMFSGIWLRALSFLVVYVLLLLFLRSHAKKVERPLTGDMAGEDFKPSPAMDRALALFGGILGLGIVLVLSSSFITALQDYTMIIVAAMFLVAGLISTLAAGMSPKKLGSSFINGLISVLPAVLMILMASSIKYTLTEGKILDTILYYAVAAAGTLPRWVVILFLYLVVLVMNFFIPSGSAKAFLLLPLILPVAQIFNLSSQLCVVAYAFGDGFSNVLYPTNPVLLISLGLAGVSYGSWFKWTWKFQAVILICTSLLLLFGLAVGYA